MNSKLAGNYEKLELRFRQQVEMDRNIYKDVVYLPTMVPNGRVDYVFVGMEPSFTWARNRQDAEKQIVSGFRDFMYSRMDFILHYCIRRYLCTDRAKYYITNLSKGAMPTEQAKLCRLKRYQNWYHLFTDELKLIAEDSAKIIAIGKQVKTFLDDNNPKLSPAYILHYANTAAKWRDRYIEGRPSEFQTFKKKDSPSMQEILLEAEKLMLENHVPYTLLTMTLERLRKERNLTESQLKLIFGYKNEFGKLKIP